MSEKQSMPTTRSACAYNKKTAMSLIGSFGIPASAIDQYPGLGESPESALFANAVRDFQVDCGQPRSHTDGKLGPMTWRSMLSRFEPVMPSDNYVVASGRRLSIGHSASPYTVINFDQTGGPSLHEAGHFTSWANREIDRVIMHWGGLDPKHLQAVMSTPDRKVSTHFGVGLIDDQPVVYQYLDLAHKAWHAGKFNTNSVGIDICQQPDYKWIQRYKDKGYDVKRIKNPTHRGNKNIISIDPRIARATGAFVRDLMDKLELKERAPDHHDVVSDVSPFTLVGHHHLSSRKWDIACWWLDVFGD